MPTFINWITITVIFLINFRNNLLKIEFYFTHFNNKIIREEPLYDVRIFVWSIKEW